MAIALATPLPPVAPMKVLGQVTVVPAPLFHTLAAGIPGVTAGLHAVLR
ncbi:MAG: hypothetical protein V7K73_01075 [Nostoc sp.]